MGECVSDDRADPRPVAVLPVDSMRRFAWAGDARPRPTPALGARRRTTTGDLTIGGRTVPGEGTRAREVQQLLLSGADRDTLAAAGVGWVVVENNWNTGWSAPAPARCLSPTGMRTSPCTE
jgi:hypothetical protein